MRKAVIPFLLALIGVMIAAFVIWPERRYIAYVVLQSEGDASIMAESASAGAKESRFLARASTLEQKVTETNEIKQTIETLKLYPEEWNSVSVQDLVERYRKALSATTSRGFEGQKQTLRISFGHRDQEVARKAADYIAGRFLALNITQSQTDAQSTIQYWQRRETEAEKEWTDRRDALARNQTADPDQRRRASLDVEIAHQRYLKVLSPVSAASAKPAFSVNAIGPKLGVFDSGMEALSPEFPWWPVLGWGAGGGFALGLFILCLPLLRHVTWQHATVAIVSAAACAGIAWLVLESLVPYKSTATLRIVPSNAAQSPFDTNDSTIRSWIGGLRGLVTSNVILTNLIDNYNLGTGGSAIGNAMREPMEMLFARFKKLVEIEMKEQGRTLTISYRDRNRTAAQKVTEDITQRMMKEALRSQSGMAGVAKEFLEDEVELAAKEWTRAVHATGTNPDRLALDIELAKRRYIEMKEKLATATLVASRWIDSSFKPGQGSTPLIAEVFPYLELTEPATLPDDREDLADYICWASAFAGFMLGLVCASQWQRQLKFNPDRCEVA